VEIKSDWQIVEEFSFFFLSARLLYRARQR